ncbi:hypothetical protein BBJ28_00020002 [Nothophytophthora sp. Chile5]|nr:hypothetical protein BBJ28_00020002 [Nothophytophthora sp. Chile5]
MQMQSINCLGTRKKPFCEIEKEVNAIKKQMDAYRMTCIKALTVNLTYTLDLLDRELSHASVLRNGRSPKDRLAQLEELYEAVVGEVEARKSYMSEMISLGRPEQAATVEREIGERMTELRKIHQLMVKEKSSSNNAGNN